MLQWPFPWRRDWNIQNLRALITGEYGTSQLSQLYLHTCRKMLSTRLTGSSSHLRFTLDHEKMLHWKQQKSSPERERERERFEHTVWDKNGYKAELLKPFSWFRTHKNGSKIQGYHSQPEFPVPPNEFHHGRTIPASPRVIGNGTKVPP